MKTIKVGEKYNKLTVLENHHPKDEVVCLCECGNIKIARASNVYYGGTKSCGCLVGGNFKHGCRKTTTKNRLYGIWKGIRARCYTKTSTSYARYGAKGITMCSEWDDFVVFKDWALSNGYVDGLTIDRIDCSGNYEPSNCRWVTYKENNNNRSNTRHLTINNETRTLSEWSEISGINYSCIHNRLSKGWSPEKAVFTPKHIGLKSIKGGEKVK